jgi:cell division protein FtsZ
MTTRTQLPGLTDLKPKLTVIGVGGAGCNAINNMIASGLVGVDFIVANTDAQALAASSAQRRLQLGVMLTEGLGAGSRPEIGEAAAEEVVEEIRVQIAGSHMVFIAAGMGGGTGTGAAAVIARVAKELGILTVGVVTKPFLFEGARRMRVAEVGVAELKNFVDTLIVIPNQNLFRIASEKTTFAEAFVMADQVLHSGIACIVDLIIKEGLINLDFADVRTVMSGMGTAMMGTGEASGDRRATIAAEEAISNPLLDDVTLKGAKGLLLSIIGGPNLTLYEVDEAASRVRQEVDPEANIIVGATFDESLGDRVRVSIVASGMARVNEADRLAQSAPDTAARTPQPQPSAHSHVPSPATETAARTLSPQMDIAARMAAKPATSNAATPYTPPPVGEQTHVIDEMQRRLTEALQNGGHGGRYGGSEPSRRASEETAPRTRETWQAPGNVLIEAGPPQLPSVHAPPPLPSQGYGSEASGAGSFTPSAPHDIRRPPRRMPELGDFPPVAQRAYQALAGEEHDYGGATAAEGAWPAHDVPRRQGLFERIAGRVLGESDSRPRPRGEQVYGDPALEPRGAAPQRARYSESGARADTAHPQQEAELPVFFRREQK